MRRTTFTAVAGLVPLLLAACGQQPTASAPGEPVRSAAQELDCAGGVYQHGAGDYVDGGLERVADDPLGALEDLVAENDPGVVPQDGYQEVRQVDGRALLTYTVDGRVRVAFVAVDGMEDWDGGKGWGIDSWAVCDPAELPAAVTDGWWMDVWTDADGARVPVAEVYSYDGPEHCDWQDIVFLQVGKDTTYLRDTSGELADFTRTSYDGSSRLPQTATRTGWQHEGRALWLVPSGEAAYLVSVDDRSDVERWPASKGFGCA